jgi:predicted TIM-barrel fold metal-dependent hydrolase
VIWDVHSHLNAVDGRTPEEKMTGLLRYADRLGIERLCVFMGFPFLTDPKPEQLRQQNDQVLQGISHHHDRAFGFVYCSGKYPEASVREIDRCVKNGPMIGVKLWVAHRCNGPELDPIIARATELQAPILQHTWFKVGGNLPGESTPLDLVELAKRHPDAKLICGHTGGDWPLGVRAIRATKTVVTEISGSDPTTGMVEMAVRELGAERVLFGSDCGSRSFASQLAKVMDTDVPEDAKKLILKENVRRLLLPILQAKGIKA